MHSKHFLIKQKRYIQDWATAGPKAQVSYLKECPKCPQSPFLLLHYLSQLPPVASMVAPYSQLTEKEKAWDLFTGSSVPLAGTTRQWGDAAPQFLSVTSLKDSDEGNSLSG